jgi:Peptidase family M1 domain
MENWGLVTYRETALLIDAAQSSAASKQTVALVVGHEIAHQWFGNLVTMVSSYEEPLCTCFCICRMLSSELYYWNHERHNVVSRFCLRILEYL